MDIAERKNSNSFSEVGQEEKASVTWALKPIKERKCADQ